MLFLGSHFGPKTDQNPLKADLQIIKKQLVFIVFLASGGPRGAPGGRFKTGPKTEADGCRLAARILADFAEFGQTGGPARPGGGGGR